MQRYNFSNPIQSVLDFKFQTQNNVYEILSDVNSRQDIMDERIASLEDRINAVQVSLDVLPDLLSRLVLTGLPDLICWRA
jgi:hypothetical protein